MPSLNDLKPDARFYGLFIGDSGSGKKVAAASFPRPILFLDFDSRIRGLLGAPFLDMKDIGDVEFFPPKTKAGEYTFQKVNDLLEKIQGQCNIGMCKYKTIYIGSITGAAFAFLQDANVLTHKGDGKGRKLGPMNMTGPQDYGFESNGIKQFLAFLQYLKDHPTGIPNIIVGGHSIPKWGKPGMDKEDISMKEVEEIMDKFKYVDNVILGEKLALTDKLSAIAPTSFDHIFKFSKEMPQYGVEVQHFVEFRGNIARTAHAKLPNGKINITGKLFYEGMMKLAGFGVESGVLEVTGK